MYQTETDDFLDEKVQTCFEKNQGYKVKDTCENRKSRILVKIGKNSK
jgi:hypothetical protein